MLEYHSIADLVALAEAHTCSIGAIARKTQAEESHISEENLNEDMRRALSVMRESAQHGLSPVLKSVSGMTGGQASKLYKLAEEGNSMSGESVTRACAWALAVAECNAAMGKIVAAPTAGACGILPAALFAAAERKNLSDEALVEALFTAAAIGKVIAERASISGAQGGCQAECGAAAAMAAAALAQLGGASPALCARATAFSLMNVMGLVCDPVDGLVEVPCVYRNVMGVMVALSSADMALADVRLILPCDEVIDAMRRVGNMLPSELKETGKGGCALCRRTEG